MTADSFQKSAAYDIVEATSREDETLIDLLHHKRIPSADYLAMKRDLKAGASCPNRLSVFVGHNTFARGTR